jgi:predicted PurR-regulated permease PerM
LVPRWLDRLAAVGWRVLVTFALAFVLAVAAINLETVTATVVVSLLATVSLLPLVSGLRSRGASPTGAAIYGVLVGAGVAILGALLIAIALLPYAGDVAAAASTGLSDLRDSLVDVGVPSWVLEAYDRLATAIAAAAGVNVAALIGPIASIVTVALLSTFLTFFLLQDGEHGWAWAMGSMAPWQATAVTGAARTGLGRVTAYLGRTAVFASVDAMVVAAALAIFGVPLIWPLVVIAFIGGLIPFIGSVVATAVVALALIAHAGIWPGLLTIAAIAAAGIATGRLISRTHLGRDADVHPLLVLIAIPTGVALFGVIGLFAVLPVVVFLLTISRSIVVALGVRPRSSATVVEGDVPIWLDRLAQWSWRGLIVAGLIWLVIQVSILLPGVVIPTVLAGVLAASLAPAVRRLRSAGWSAGMAAAVTTVAAVVIAVGAVVATVVFSVGPFGEIIDTALEGADLTGLEWLSTIVAAIGTELIANLAGVLRDLAAFMLTALLGLLLTFFLLRDAGALWHRLLERVGPWRRERADAIGMQTVHILGGYMIGTGIISLFGAITGAVIMILLGLPFAIPIAILSFAAGFIPYVGSFLSTGLATLVAIAVGTTSDVIVMLIWTVVFNIVQGNFVTPIVYGRTMSLHPAIILLAIPAGNEVAGVLGMFLVVPFVAITAAVLRPTLELIANEGSPESPQAPVPKGPRGRQRSGGSGGGEEFDPATIAPVP